MVAGVCGGLGAYFNVNPVFYRIGFVVLTFLGGAGILVYGACALVIPSEGEKESIASDILRNHRQRPVALVGLVLAAVAGVVLLSHISFRFHGDAFWAVVLVAGALLLWSQSRATAPPPAAPDAASSASPAGATPVTSPDAAAPPAPSADTESEPASAAPARRRRSVLTIFLVILGALVVAAAIAVVVVATIFSRLAHGVGDRHYTPVTASALQDDYQVGVGSLDLDLSRVSLPPGTTRIHVEAGIGHLRIMVPPGVSVHAGTHVTWGEATLLGHEESGHNVRAEVGAENGRLDLDTKVGIGQVEVVRSVR
jgi:phage shock protein PspC (stress-responsive transcriptional regulator)